MHDAEIRRHIADQGQAFSMAKVAECYEAGEVDATWHCIWCMLETDPNKRDYDTLIRDAGLISLNAAERNSGRCAWLKNMRKLNGKRRLSPGPGKARKRCKIKAKRKLNRKRRLSPGEGKARKRCKIKAIEEARNTGHRGRRRKR